MINHVTLKNGCLIFEYGLDYIGSGKTVQEIVELINKYGLDKNYSLSGALYFSKYYGFEEDDSALNLWNESLEKSNYANLCS